MRSGFIASLSKSLWCFPAAHKNSPQPNIIGHQSSFPLYLSHMPMMFYWWLFTIWLIVSSLLISNLHFVKIHIFTPCSVVNSRGLLRFFSHNNWFLYLFCELIVQSVLIVSEWTKFHFKCQFWWFGNGSLEHYIEENSKVILWFLTKVDVNTD